MILKLSITLLLLSMMFTYMFIRMVKGAVEKENGTYKPKILLSIVELIFILAILSSLSYMAFDEKYGIVGVVLFSVLSFVLSFIIVNNKTVETFDKALPVLATLFYFGFFVTGYFG